MSNSLQILTRLGRVSIPAAETARIDPALQDLHGVRIAPNAITLSGGFNLTLINNTPGVPEFGTFEVQNVTSESRDLFWEASFLTSVQLLPNQAIQTDLGPVGVQPSPNPPLLVVANDLSLQGQAEGDITYFDGTNWKVIPAGTIGQVLTQSVGPIPAWSAAPGGPPSGPAGGDLGGAYPNPEVNDLTIAGEVSGSVLYFDGVNWVELSPGVAGQVLTLTGGLIPSWAAVSSADKTVYFPIDWNVNFNDYRARSLGGNAMWRISFFAPDDLGSLVSLALMGIPSAGAAGAGKDIDLFSDYGGLGEDNQNHNESDTTSTYNLGVVGEHIDLDVSAVFSVLAAGDRCGLLFDHNGIGGSMTWLGLKMVYTPA